jgi:ATP phosphoribosyltransferase regulatory subunit
MSAEPDISAKSLAGLRERSGLTQSAAAAEIGVSQATYSRWEKENNEPTGAARRALADWVVRRSQGALPALNAAFPVRLGISDPDKAEELAGRLSAAGYKRVEPPILQPAAAFLDVSGEDLRRRMFLTSDAEGNELCLRPDLTIPTARLHLAGANPATRADYFYLGPVFRQRETGSGEVQQAGLEIFGREDREAAEAEVIALSSEALALYGIKDAELVLGDRTLFLAFIHALDIPDAWRRRLMRDIARQSGLGRDLAALAPAPSSGAGEHTAFLAALDGADPKAAKAVVEDMLSIAGISQVGGRSPGDIAERFLEQARLRASASLPAATHDALSDFLTVETDPVTALRELRKIIASALKSGALASDATLSAGLDAFERRNAFVAARGVDLGKVKFSTAFGRQLDYYTGLVFEFRSPHLPALGPLIGGGRYDGLLTALGSPAPVPAVGCAMFVERMTEAAQ